MMTATDRIPTLDFLRGVAVMGILVANLPAFGLPEAAYFSPAAWGGTAPADVAMWFATYVLVEGKMRGLFAMLFGASMLLVVERAQAAGRNPAAVHYRRMAWLLAIGCVHLYGLWWGDILAHYALCGMIAYAACALPVRWLIAGAAMLVGWQTLQATLLYVGLAMAQAHPGTGDAFVAAVAGEFGIPSPARLAAEVAAYRGDYARVFAWRWHDATSPVVLLPILGPETLASMLLGMAGLKSGFLTGAWERARYRRWAAVCLGVALPVYAAVGLYVWRSGFALRDVVFGSMVLPAPLRSLAIVGYAALLMLTMRPEGWLTRRIAAAGRVALSNYLGTTLVMTTLFYGYGAGLFGRWSRAELYLTVPVAWAAMLAWSQPWLAAYRFGPIEWLWRSLARGRMEAMNGAAGSTDRASR